MHTFRGEKVVGGIAIGKIAVVSCGGGGTDYHKESPKQEREKFQSAREKTLEQIERLRLKALEEIGEEEAYVFEAHTMMLQDLDLEEMIVEKIQQDLGAKEAISQARDYFSSLFLAMEDSYMQARSADVCDICNQMIDVLDGVEHQEITEPSLIVAMDLTPSQTLKMNRNCFLALITQEGSSCSHTAIMARTMGIPAINQIQIESEWDGEMAILDANEAQLIIAPSQEVLQKYQKLQEQEREKQSALLKLKQTKTCTKDGKEIKLYANIGGLEDAKTALDNGAEGIGLFRSEFLYLSRTNLPTEQEQFEIYKEVLEMMENRRVIVRTLDIGADKRIDYLNLDREENPALGYRAIRICLNEIEIFKTQLRALYRASVYGKLAIMFPMIIAVWEIRRIKAMIGEVQQELRDAGVAFDDQVEIGVMIETPASVMIAQELAAEVDFFSIGSNDLAQYTFALDRQNPKIENYHQSFDIALKRMFAQVIENAHKQGIWVGICGEMASDVDVLEELLRLGFDELSVSPKMILPMRQKILDFED
ncbi:phosphoenolpyruvate--protein phosphotransferase [Helicobacter enhydrae]|uniref:Phosphoenolpyruvate-protein phosphotransferase n=1 Tax=Helicobacter enhydrae TaxID=222136 RepID=A0A1B1U3R6_9HELI|nr:phosphoenolpyruvate--protein phosphotransferase [Helicobacter enhydrae]ANV97372.1 phosphoenolpyruvate--protein phosphotransferase [Helicobacter enhydrae]